MCCKSVGRTICQVVLFLAALCAPLPAQLATSDHLQDPGFWPTQSLDSAADIVGPAVCLDCHRKMTPQLSTPMAQNASRPPATSVLQSHNDLDFFNGNIHYQIKTSGADSIYSVTDGTRTLVARLLWAFGTGRVGQSYLFKKEDGDYYEARVTYFTSLHNIEWTPARALPSPRDLEEAMDRPVGSSELARCFACHTTAGVIGDKLDEQTLIPGVSCEACHGPGAKHSANMVPGAIFNPARLMPTDSVDFCGACHGSFWDVVLAGIKGPSTARSQPYRLETSKCWGKGDARFTCIGCHDPHQPLQTDPEAYDGVCQSCHATKAVVKPAAAAAHVPPSCPVGDNKCVSCHMPKVYVPEMHGDFTDHRIRIAHPGEPYPE